MKKRAASARPLLMRAAARSTITAGQLLAAGEVFLIASLVVLVFFNLWLGIITTLIGGALAAAGYFRADEKRWPAAKKYLSALLARIWLRR
jgi:hypothetical protein